MSKIEKIAKQNNIKNIEILFVDLFGNNKSVVIPSTRLADAIKFGLKCDGSNVCLEQDICRSDTRLCIDKNSYYIMPDNSMVVFCTTDSKYDARQNLKNIQNKISDKCYDVNFGAEIEFYLFKKNPDKALLQNVDNQKYFGEIQKDCKQCLSEVNEYCKLNGIQVEAVHHEVGESQFELDFKYDLPLVTADRVIIIKKLLRYFADKHNLFACFMPKPKNFVSGNGMHINMSVFKNKKNMFYSKTDCNGISRLAYEYMENIMKHISAITAFANPITNSYKRLNTGYEAPTTVKYSSQNRNVLLRLPKASQNTTRVELRSPDTSCNPYLTFSAVLMAGFCNLFCKNDCVNCTPLKLPKTLSQSLCALSSDNLISSLVPVQYIDKKLAECAEVENLVSNIDLQKYLNV